VTGARDLLTGEQVLHRSTVGSRKEAIDAARFLQGPLLRVALTPYLDTGRWAMTVYERPHLVREAEWLADLPAECRLTRSTERLTP
jgi:hypothetical protein